MTWSLAFPNLLVGLREGLEAGLVVAILVGAVRRLDPARSLAGVWIGVAAAAVLSLSFGAVLTFTRAELSPRAQEIFGGLASLVAVALVTAMVFWMRRAAGGIAGDLRGQVGGALAAGGGALALTAFAAVAREGLEAALFVWTNAQAAGSTASPLLGALIGLLIASALCIGLYRRVVSLDLVRFFRITGAILLVIVAGVLAYGLRDLQDAGLLPGQSSNAFDISRQVPTGRWWTELIRGVTNLDNRMSWLQLAGYLGYLAVALPLFLRVPAGQQQTPPAAPTPAAPAPTAPAAGGVAPRRKHSRVRVALAAAVLLVPVAAAGSWIAADHTGTHRSAARVTVTSTSCAADWAAPAAPTQLYAVTNTSPAVVDVEFVESSTQALLAEIEVLGPGTTRDLPVSFGGGAYNWKCLYAGLPEQRSASRSGAPGTPSAAGRPLPVTTAADLEPALGRYRDYVRGQLDLLAGQVGTLRADLRRGERAAARRDWLRAHLTYHRMGAAYDAFGELGDAVDGLAQGLAGGVSDPRFAGFHRIEHDLWSGADLPTLTTEAARLLGAVRSLRDRLPSFTFDPNDVTTRAHEILEDTVRFTLTGQDDYGSGSGFATAQADLDGDRTLVGLLADVLQQRSPDLVARADALMSAMHSALTSAGGGAVGTASAATRRSVNGATGQLLELLAPIPDLLEVRSR